MAVDDAGRPFDDALCPSDPVTQSREIEAFVELAKTGVAGVQLDHIRQNGASSCFCPRCRALFEKSIGRTVADWPKDVRKGDALNPINLHKDAAPENIDIRNEPRLSVYVML